MGRIACSYLFVQLHFSYSSSMINPKTTHLYALREVLAPPQGDALLLGHLPVTPPHLHFLWSTSGFLGPPAPGLRVSRAWPRGDSGYLSVCVWGGDLPKSRALSREGPG